MGLVLPFDANSLDAATASALDDLIAPLQTWAGKVDGAGRWIDVPYDAQNFYAMTGTWTVPQGTQKQYRYTVLQDVMFLRINLQDTSTGVGMGNDLRIRLPQGYRTSDNGFLGVFQWNADTAAIDGLGRAYAMAAPGNTVIRLLRDVLATSTAWPSSETRSLGIRLNIMLPVYRDLIA